MIAQCAMAAFFLAAASGCGPTVEANAADPPGDQPSSFFRSSETSLVHPGNGLNVVTAFNDQSGMFTFDATNNSLPYKAPNTQSMAGLSYSLDGGHTWTRKGALPTNPSCGKAKCPRLLRGDPWLSVGSGLDVYYSELAATVDGATAENNTGYPDAVAVAKSGDGGVTWLPFQVALLGYITPGTSGAEPSSYIDKPSISVSGKTVAVAATQTGVNGGIRIAVSENGGATWLNPTSLPDDQLSSRTNPIIKLISSTSGYLCYMVDHGDYQPYDVSILRIKRKVGSSAWSTTPVFRQEGIQSFPYIEGALGRWWRDLVPVSFDVNGSELYLTYRVEQTEMTRTIIEFLRCDDSLGTCTFSMGNGNSVGWKETTFTANNPGFSEYQPHVEAGPSGRVALTWYQQFAAQSIYLVGSYSTNYGTSWSSTYNLRPDFNQWTPCPTASATQATPGDIGDYFGSTFMGAQSIQTADGPVVPYLVTTFTDSQFCQSLNEITYDQHVQSVIW